MRKTYVLLASILLAGLAIMASMNETWSKSDSKTELEPDSHRVGKVEHIYKEELSSAKVRKNINLAVVTLSDNGYGYIGHITASIPKGLSLRPGEQVEVILKENASDHSPNRIVRKLKAPETIL